MIPDRPALRVRFVTALWSLFVSVGCASVPLPPHVWLPVERVERVDLFYWTDLSLCQIRVVWWDRTYPRGFTTDVERSLCLERLKADGYAVPLVQP